jgi:hypothetical protein
MIGCSGGELDVVPSAEMRASACELWRGAFVHASNGRARALPESCPWLGFLRSTAAITGTPRPGGKRPPARGRRQHLPLDPSFRLDR